MPSVKRMQQQLADIHEQLDMAEHENAVLRNKLKSMQMGNDKGPPKTVVWDIASIYPWATGAGNTNEHEACSADAEESWCGSDVESVSDTDEGSERTPKLPQGPTRSGYITRDQPGPDEPPAGAGESESEDPE